MATILKSALIGFLLEAAARVGRLLRMLGRLLLWAATVAYVGALPPARGADGAEVAVSRTYSTMYFMRTVCPKYIRIDLGFASKMSAILARGNKELNVAAMQAAIVPEVERRRAEVLAAGEALGVTRSAPSCGKLVSESSSWIKCRAWWQALTGLSRIDARLC